MFFKKFPGGSLCGLPFFMRLLSFLLLEFHNQFRILRLGLFPVEFLPLFTIRT